MVNKREPGDQSRCQELSSSSRRVSWRYHRA